MNPNKLIGKRVNIIDKNSIWFKHWGFIILFDGNVFHVSGGSIAASITPDVAPVFDRNQFRVKRKQTK